MEVASRGSDGYAQPLVQPRSGSGNLLLLTAALMATVVGLLTPNPALTVSCALTLLVLVKLLWRPGEPPVLLFAATYQWIQISAKVFHADYRGEPLIRLASSSLTERAVELSLLGLALLALGMRLGIGRLHFSLRANPRDEAKLISSDRLFVAYLGVAVVGSLATFMAAAVASLSQFFLSIGGLRWAAYYLLGYTTFVQRAKKSYFALATLAEFVIGIGYFSEFKIVIFVALLALLSVQVRSRGRSAFIAITAGVFLLIVALGWTRIKQDYRLHVSGGRREQVVVVSPTERVKIFISMMTSLTTRDLQLSIDQLAERMAYVDYFGSVLERVPSLLPYENGALLWGAIEHVLLPRFLFPNKAALLSDSDLTRHYTGKALAGNEEGTSISMGYMTESYIDFGPLLMFVPILLLGVAWGGMYRYMISRASLTVIGYAFATALLINANQFEITGIKLIGGMLAKFLVLAVILRFGVPRVAAWLTERRGAAAATKNADAAPLIVA